MGRITKLDTQTANMIAAGEVVERPMGVVKELVENAIDAGSTRITISVEEGGLSKITITDNGCGMDQDDAQMCFGRHATSKIHQQNDLWSIHTLGFRGEALPSISSVSKVTLCTSDGKDATKVVIAYGKKEEACPYPCNQGTEITVEGLFYQTPARLKHMRSASYEASLIHDVITKFALSHPEIAFRFTVDGKDTFRSTGQGNLLEVLYSVYGKSVAENAIEVNFSDFDYQVKGYLVKPLITRASRNMMHIFLNGRMVKTYKLYKCIQDAYEPFMPKGRYPLCVLVIDMDPHLLDVNVHPSKWEVRISKENQLEYLIKDEITKILSSSLPIYEEKPQPIQTEYYQPLSFDMDELPKQPEPEVHQKPTLTKPKQEVTYETTYNPVQPLTIQEEARQDELQLKQIHEELEQQPQPKEEKPTFPHLDIIGQYKQEYILASCSQGLAVIDQKAAQSRYEYEQLLQQFQKQPTMLDLVIPVSLTTNEMIVKRLEELNKSCTSLHITFEAFGKDTLIVRRVPSWTKELALEQFLQDLLDAFLNEKNVTVETFYQDKIAQIASKHTIHRNTKLTMDEMQTLVEHLSCCDNAYTSPSGKPTMIILENQDWLRRFRK